MEKYLILFIIFLSLFACAPKEFNPPKLDSVQFEKTQPYNINLDDIQKPEKINVLYVDEFFKETSIDNAKYVLFYPKEYSKIAALLRLCKTYKDIILEQEKIINIKIDEINSFKDYVTLEQKKKEGYWELWVISENAYRQEKYDNSMNRLTSYTFFGSVTFMSLIALIIAL